MATYFHGNPSEIGGAPDGLQTLILMNPAYVGYADQNQHHHHHHQHHQQQQQQPQSSNFVFLNNNNNNNNNAQGLPHAPPSQTQHFVGVPLHSGNSPSSASPHDHQGVSALHHGFLHPRAHNYGLYNLPPDLGAAREVTRANQGLSLSLSSSQPPPHPPGYGSFCRNERPEVGMDVSPGRGDDVRVSSVASPVTNGVNGVQSVLLSSKYLKAAQELLDEVVNVGKGVKATSSGAAESSRGQAKTIGDTSAASGEGQSGGESSGKRGAAELTTAERQEIQMKKAKLVNMLDEVEQRYMQYHHQMQIVISWFEQAAGVGSAKTYTALALQTISKQFRCLKDAILAQIRAASRSLGEDETNLEGKIEGSRLKYVDNQIRQQRALQQLGMIQHNAWRPQRGLPERSVSVLRAWLFEHFLHPYPKDSDKLMLAKQTGLTRSQVSNWFINARVRLWKPMVEEMYTEEMKENDKNGSEDNNNNNNNNNRSNKTEHNEDSTSKSTAFPQAKSPNTEHHNNPNMIISMSTNSASPTGPTVSTIGHSIPGFNMPSEIESITHNNNHSPKKLRISDMLHGYDRQGDKDGFTLMGAPANFIGGFGSYPMGDLGRFGADQFPYSGSSSNNNNGVSLTLGLPHCENNIGAHQSFLPNQGMQQLGRGVEIGETGGFGGMSGHQTNAQPGNVYENISIPDRKRFAAQLLPDFVA